MLVEIFGDCCFGVEICFVGVEEVKFSDKGISTLSTRVFLRDFGVEVSNIWFLGC